jgi:hypothetical protein
MHRNFNNALLRRISRYHYIDLSSTRENRSKDAAASGMDGNTGVSKAVRIFARISLLQFWLTSVSKSLTVLDSKFHNVKQGIIVGNQRGYQANCRLRFSRPGKFLDQDKESSLGL